MTLNDLFESLANGELSNLFMAEQGTISQSKRKSITLYANEALLRLYTRFPLWEKDLLLEMKEAVTNYHLLSRYAYSKADQHTCIDPYIMDTADPFLDDVIRVVRVYNTYGIELPLNDEGARHAIFTPQPRIIQVPNPVVGNVLNVVYRAQHPKLSVDKLDQEIELPDILIPALHTYIAYKALTAMNTAESTGVGQLRQAQFDAMCAELVEQDIIGATISTSTDKFSKRGWI